MAGVRRLLLTIVALLSLVGVAPAADLRFAISVGPTTIDPQYHNYYANLGIHQNVYETLIDMEPDGKLIPMLAVSWKVVEPTVWEFKLRQNVKFHDGADFTAKDVVASIDRIRGIKGSVGPLATFVQDIASSEIVDPHTIRFKTTAPSPTLPYQLLRVFILSSSNTATTAEIDAGKGAIGTGPYKNVKYVRDDEWVVARNDAWWGPKQAWDRIIFKTLSNDASRLAAFMSGSFDVIQGVPLANIKQLEKDQRFKITAKPSLQNWWVAMDTARDDTPYVKDASGAPLAKNPLKDPRVRKALLMSINRQALVDRFLEGYGVVATQVVAPSVDEGVKIPLVPYDPNGAKKLLADAGYPNGFSLTFSGMVGVLPLDDQICQAIGQFFTRIGVKTNVETAPPSLVVPRAAKGELSIYFTGAPTLDAYQPLKLTQMTPDKAKNTGSANRLSYSNPEFDKLMDEVLETMDDTRRKTMLAKAVQLLMADTPILPLFHQSQTWASRKDIKYLGGPTLANQGSRATLVK
jgi:peptide/nickel transport system substrate-binding protein